MHREVCLVLYTYIMYRLFVEKKVFSMQLLRFDRRLYNRLRKLKHFTLIESTAKQCFFGLLKICTDYACWFFRDFFIRILNGCNFKKCLCVFFVLILLLNETKHCSRAVFFLCTLFTIPKNIIFLWTDATFINCHAS